MQHLGRLPVRKSLGRRIRHPLLARDLPPRRVPLSRRALVSRSSPTTTIGVIQIGRGKAGRKCPLKHILKFYFFSLVWGINGEDFFWQDFCMITKAGIHGVFISLMTRYLVSSTPHQFNGLASIHFDAPPSTVICHYLDYGVYDHSYLYPGTSHVA